MAFYYSKSTNAFYSSDITPTASMPSDKVALTDAEYKDAMSKQAQGYRIVANTSTGKPQALDQSLTDATAINGANIDGVVKTINGGAPDAAGEVTVDDYVTGLVADAGRITFKKKNGTSGVTTIKNLPIANGGTGAATADDALTNLGIDTAIVGLASSGTRIKYTRKNGSTGLVGIPQYDTNFSVMSSLIKENTFRSTALTKALNFGLYSFILECFSDVSDVNTSVGAGATVSAMHNADRHSIEKTSAETIIIQSLAKTITTANAKAWVLTDWSGSGSVKVSVSRDGGSTFTTVEEDTLTDISAQPAGTSMVCRLTITGQVTFDNIAWGFKD